jgi:hypothetical protein
MSGHHPTHPSGVDAGLLARCGRASNALRVRIIIVHTLLPFFDAFGSENPPRILDGVFALDNFRLNLIKFLGGRVEIPPGHGSLLGYIFLLLTSGASRIGVRGRVPESVRAEDDEGVDRTRDVVFVGGRGSASFTHFNFAGHF